MIFEKGLATEAYKECNGKLISIDIPYETLNQYAGMTTIMNPSIYNDNGVLKCVVRGTQYILHHSLNNSYPCWSGPLHYIHREDDVLLRTENFLVEFDENFNTTNIRHIDMMKLHEPIWDFWGLEDARLFRWDDKLYICGVRRDTTDNGVGRMELCQIEEREDGTVREISRDRIPSINEETDYCEKNWMPILDKPFTFLRWISPTQTITYNLPNKSISVWDNPLSVSPSDHQLRGGSHVVHFKNHYICIGHIVDFWVPYGGEKNATYSLFAAIYDEDMNLLKVSTPFKMIDNPIEFVCGLCQYGNDLIASFGYCDDSAYLLKFDGDWFVNKILNEQ